MTARDYPYPPRMMTRERAAHYSGLALADFDREVLAGTLPAHISLGKAKLWSRKALDEALDQLESGGVPEWRVNSHFHRKRRNAA